MSSNEALILHIWPGAWGLSSLHPTCLAAVLYLQLAVPGRFTVAESTNPDASPSGVFPYVTHDKRVVSSLALIVKYVSALPESSLRSNGEDKDADAYIRPDLDKSLVNGEKARKVAWCAHVESQLGDLVAHMLFSLNANYWSLTRPTLASQLPIPQRYYVPSRIRASYRPRLEASELWGIPEPEEKESETHGLWRKKKDSEVEEEAKEARKHTFKKVFEREKVLEKARATLDIYVRLLGERSFFYHNRPTTLDITLAAHVLLLTKPPYPDPLLQNLLNDSYPTLVAHAERVHSYCIPDAAALRIVSGSSTGLTSLIPFSHGVFGQDSNRGTWPWTATVAAAAAAVAWFILLGPRPVLAARPDDEEIYDALGKEMDEQVGNA
ncbi:hypothetical protein PUNSTDRAFT_104876 [Punctularia strigosozonata HHB-11173 SS5]|uniref:uncharacterized protein n=1 Tax=Punctularia strigosozonata (strain HHB-11173) TaxID=741275 RepID=UPI0004417680|nr:uncharacterized protein PUNSTDRAFT_104876 [Punctularia strigosozonata HHB-11173 SS5]EIN07269.1 hypothetical protein PUNSTDRAFT_104876 [Punctularia strigosozonata HHB-11173 SS5]